jgi:outer membrane protein, heavy metal efflux system
VGCPAEGDPVEPAFEAGDGLDALLRHAMRHSPALEADYQRWRAAVQRVPQARALPEPQLSVSLLVDEIDRSADYMGERYALIPGVSLVRQAGLARRHGARRGRSRGAAIRGDPPGAGRAVTAAWFEYAWVHQAGEVARENRELLLRLESVARARYRVGEVSLADVSRAQVELGRIDEQLRSLIDRRVPAAAALNAALGRPAHAQLPEPVSAELAGPAGPCPSTTRREWLARARAQNPELAAGRHDAEREARGIELARREYYPDFMIGVEYERGGSARMARMDGGGSDMVAGMLSFSIPIRRARYDAGLAEARARHVAASRTLASRELGLEAELQAALFEYRDSVRKLELYGATCCPWRAVAGRQRSGLSHGRDGLFRPRRCAARAAGVSLAQERAAVDRALAVARIKTLVGESPVPNEGEPRS